MSKFLDIKQSFEVGSILKSEFVEQMGAIHSILFDYQNLIKNSIAKKIEITETNVIITLQSGIKLHCIKDDNRIIPIEILNFGHYEEPLWDKFASLLNSPSVIFDIGGNIGYFSLYMANKFQNACFYTFEPIPKTYEYLKENLKENNTQNINAYNMGLTNEKQTMEMFYNPKGCGGSSLKNICEENYIEKIICEFSTLDDFVKENNITSIDVIKCDVEGAEKFVFEGGLETLKKFKPVIFTEMLRKWSAKFNYHPNDIIALLSPLGYKCFAISETTYNPIDKVDENTIETNFIFTTNY